MIALCHNFITVSTLDRFRRAAESEVRPRMVWIEQDRERERACVLEPGPGVSGLELDRRFLEILEPKHYRV